MPRVRARAAGPRSSAPNRAVPRSASQHGAWSATVAWTIAGAVALSGCNSSSNTPAPDQPPAISPEARAALSKLRYDGAAPPPDPSNRFDQVEKARQFGHRLFFDPRLSGPLIDGDNDGSEVALGKNYEPGRVSCAGCHIPDSGFVDTRSRGKQVSLGARWTVRRTPHLSDVAFVPLFNWDGRRDSLWRQAIGVMEGDREYNSGRLFVAQQIHRLHRAEYESIFGAMPQLDDAARFPPLTPEQAGCRLRPGLILECRGKPGDQAEYDKMASSDQDLVTEVVVNVAKAMAAHLARLRCGPGRFDDWLDGNTSALSPAEQKGAALFVGKARCVECHSGPRLTDDEFHNVGLKPARVAVVVLDANDRGAGEGIPAAIADPLNTRGKFSDGDRGALPSSVGPEMEGAFRTPTLRCSSLQPSFMHTAQLRSLSDVVAFFNVGGHPDGYPGKSEIQPLGLTDLEQADLVSFLQTLVGQGPTDELKKPPPEFVP
jgi:cytochrome c peroxidase